MIRSNFERIKKISYDILYLERTDDKKQIR